MPTSQEYSEEEQWLWSQIADVLFLERHRDPREYENLARNLKKAGWTKDKLNKLVLDIMIPVVVLKPGYVLWPAMREWGGFERKRLCRRMIARMARRKAWPPYAFALQDWLSRKVVGFFNLDKVLEKLPDPQATPTP